MVSFKHLSAYSLFLGVSVTAEKVCRLYRVLIAAGRVDGSLH